MDKICIFCGEKPKNKNREHVLPQWLMEATGDPKRIVDLGYNYEKNKKITFDWKNFTAPSCTSCNEEYSELEGFTKPIVEKLLLKEPLITSEILYLLDWLDKIRIGLWLNYYYLEENKAAIQPHLCVNNRLGMKDRFLQIHFLESKKKQDGLNAFGVDSFAFQYLPSCFGLRINNLLLINASSDFIISKNCGFPYPSKVTAKENGIIELGEFNYDRQISSDLFGLNIHRKGVLTIFQPIHTTIPYQSDYFSDSFLLNNCFDPSTQTGGLFRLLDSNVLTWEENDATLQEYEPVTGADVTDIGVLISMIYKYQNHFLSELTGNSNRDAFVQAKEINLKYIEHYELLNKYA